MSNPSIGQMIRERRLARGFSLGQLAVQLGQTPAAVRDWERGTELPPPGLVADLASALELDSEDLSSALQLEVAESPAALEAEAEGEAVMAGAATEEAVPRQADAGKSDEESPDEPQAEDEHESDEESPDEPDAEDGDGDEDAGAASGAEREAVSEDAVDGAEESPPDSEADPEPAGAITGGFSDAGATKASVVADLEEEPVPRGSSTPVGASHGTEGAVALREAPTAAHTPVAFEAAPPASVADEPTRRDLFRNPLEYVFDPHRPYLYWLRYVLTIVILFILLRVLVWGLTELWSALGELLDTFRSSDELEALRVLLPPA